MISPVLTKDDESKQRAGGSPSSLETSGQEAYNTVHRMVASKVRKDILWTGSDCGLVFVTKDGGKNWENVSPDLPEDSDVYEIEASPHDAGAAYIAVSRYRTANDFLPYLFKTSDYGKTWKNFSEDFPQTEKAGADSEIAKRAAAFSNALAPAGKNLSEIANEPAKLLSKLQTVHWVLFHCEGRPPRSAFAVVDTLEKKINAEIAAWQEFLSKAEKK